MTSNCFDTVPPPYRWTRRIALDFVLCLPVAAVWLVMMLAILAAGLFLWMIGVIE